MLKYEVLGNSVIYNKSTDLLQILLWISDDDMASFLLANFHFTKVDHRWPSEMSQLQNLNIFHRWVRVIGMLILINCYIETNAFRLLKPRAALSSNSGLFTSFTHSSEANQIN